MVGLQTLDLAIGVRVPASQPKNQTLKGRLKTGPPVLCAYSVPAEIVGLILCQFS